jgi:hypothetical protein
MSENLVSKAFIEFLNTVSVSSTTKVLHRMRDRIGKFKSYVFLRRADLANATPNLRQVLPHRTSRAAL